MNDENYIFPVMAALAVFAILIISAVFLASILNSPVTNHPLIGNEVINATVTADHFTGVNLPLPPEGGSYCINASTTARGVSAAEIQYGYYYNVTTTTTDKFGTYNTTTTTTGGWPALGITNDVSNIDVIFVVPKTALSTVIHVFTHDRAYAIPNTIVNVVVRPCQVPDQPKQPVPGAIVKCSSYYLIDHIYFSSDGYRVVTSTGPYSDFNLNNPIYIDKFYSGAYFTVISDKYASYSVPSNLTVINKTADVCQVTP